MSIDQQSLHRRTKALPSPGLALRQGVRQTIINMAQAHSPGGKKPQSPHVNFPTASIFFMELQDMVGVCVHHLEKEAHQCPENASW